MKEKTIGVLMGILTLLTTNNSVAEATLNKICLSSKLPVVNEKIEFTLDIGDSSEQDADFAISDENGQLAKLRVTSQKNKLTATWLPAETGFYTASFKFSKGKKVSLTFPVVWRNMYFMAYGTIPADTAKLKYLCQYMICKEAEIPLLKSTGCKPLQWRGNAIDMKKDEKECIDNAVAYWSAPLQKGFDGIFIDEFGGYPNVETMDKVERIRKALIRLRKENPNMLIFAANCGALLPQLAVAYRESGSIALLETYPSVFTKVFDTHSIKKYFLQRIETARHTDLIVPESTSLSTALMLLNVNGCLSFLEEPQSPEKWVRYIKKEAPEMPGLTLWNGGVTREYCTDNKIYSEMERLIHEYYIKPVIDLREISFSNYTPSVGNPVDVLVEVHNLGGMEAKAIKLKLYAKMVHNGETTLIGDITIKKIGCGHKRVNAKNTDKAYEFQTVNENVYAVQSGERYRNSTVFLARTTAKLKWIPKEKGYYSIVAEVEPSPQYTILDGVMESTIGIK